ncbi:OmpA family protein [Pedobacter sp. MC2016-14]|uniref:OmpA family protein n=1 Tax=Pedobacter sp. MC2016-14 TaxID=2897327 RepID=UPI001E3585AE|nr:OmpA family protein [Pedobacter sp. MC2016-14]MCD0487399.1 OmpA family protein [Pedobacter sp. MC2016-14]
MRTNNMSAKFIQAIILSIVITSCGNSDNKDAHKGTDSAAVTDSSAVTTQTQPDQSAASTEIFKDFDWTTVAQSNAVIGAFPYISAPEGFYIQEKDSYSESKTGYSYYKDFNKLFIFNGQSFYNAEGKVAKLKFRMKGENTEWNQYKFDSSVDKYLNSIGAKLLGKLKLSDEQEKFLNKDDDMAIHNHLIGDPYNVPVRFYALNHAKGKIMFQVFSNTASAEVGVVELAAFEQTIKAPTAVEMKRDIDANGKAILNINFDTDKSNLLPEGQKIVDEILILMKNNPDLKIAIEGHTDNAGSAERNKKLSAERANTILKSITGRGISASRLSAAGFGAERPLVANDSEANMAKNRRVELVKK